MCVTTRPAESAAVARARDDASCRWRGLARHHRRGDDASRRWRGTSLDATDAGRGACTRPPPAKTQDKKYKTRMCRYGAGTCPYGVSCSYAHSAVVFRVELKILFAPSTRKRVGPRAGGAPAARARRAARRADRRREPARAAPRRPALRDSGSLSAAEFEELKQQVLREPGSFAAQAPVLLAPTAPPPPRRLSPPPPDAYMLPAMAMPPRAAPRPPAYAPQPPYAAVPGPPRGYGVPSAARGYCGAAATAAAGSWVRALTAARGAAAAERYSRTARRRRAPGRILGRGRRGRPARARRPSLSCRLRSGCYFPRSARLRSGRVCDDLARGAAVPGGVHFWLRCVVASTPYRGGDCSREPPSAAREFRKLAQVPL